MSSSITLPAVDQRWNDAVRSGVLTPERALLVQHFGRATAELVPRVERRELAIMFFALAAELAMSDGASVSAYEDAARFQWAAVRKFGGPMQAVLGRAP